MAGSLMVHTGTGPGMRVSPDDKMALDPPYCKVSTEMTDAFDKIYATGKWAGKMPLQPPSYYYSCVWGVGAPS